MSKLNEDKTILTQSSEGRQETHTKFRWKPPGKQRLGRLRRKWEDNINMDVNPLPALTYQTVLDLNAACRSKRTEAYWLFSS